MLLRLWRSLPRALTPRQAIRRTNCWYCSLHSTTEDTANGCQDKSSALYVSRDVLANRDWVSWEDSGSSHPWKDHLELNAFKSKQPGTVRVGVVRNLRYNRIKCITGPANPAEALVHELEFWAYPRPVPGTRMITVANFDDSIGCMLVGEEDCEVDDWTLFFQIWLPV